MTLSDLYVVPAPETVAALVDSHGRHAAMERWGWLDATTLWKLTREGRRRAGRGRPSGALHCLGAGHELMSRGWDGPESAALRLTPATAAAALGVGTASLSRRGW